MNANEMIFGVEVETTAPDTAITNDGLRIGAYHHGIQVPYLPTGWKNTWSADVLARLVTIVAYAEKGLYAITGTKSRELPGRAGGHHRSAHLGPGAGHPQRQPPVPGPARLARPPPRL